MSQHPGTGDWSVYNAAHSDRGPRPLTVRALDLAGPGAGRTAVELGSGSGVDSRFLQARGWDVHSYDADPASAGGAHHVVTDLARVTDLPATELVLSNATLSFLDEADLRRLLDLVGEWLRPGGVFAADFWGPEDDWADGPGTYPDRADLDGLLPWQATAEITERSWDGASFAGPKHWHVFTVLARGPE